MSHKIETLSEYFKAYEESVEHPEAFWGGVAESFQWKKKGLHPKGAPEIRVEQFAHFIQHFEFDFGFWFGFLAFAAGFPFPRPDLF